MRGGATTAGWACSSLCPDHEACRERQAEWCDWPRVGDGVVRKEEAGDGQDWGVASSHHCRKLGPCPKGPKVHLFCIFLTGRLLSHRGSELYSREQRSTAIIHVTEGAGQEPRWRLLTPARALWTNAVERLQADLGFRHSFHIKPRPRRHLVSLGYARMQRGKKASRA